jgi:hypothetical protein
VGAAAQGDVLHRRRALVPEGLDVVPLRATSSGSTCAGTATRSLP